MNYAELAYVVATAIGLVVFTWFVFTAPWRISSIAERVADGVMIFPIVAVCSGFAYETITLYDPARAAAFNPCDHSKAHKRPAHCKK